MTKGITPSLVQSIMEASRQGEVGEAPGSLNEAFGFGKPKFKHATASYNAAHGMEFKENVVHREARNMNVAELRAAINHHSAEAKHKRSIRQFQDADSHLQAVRIYKHYANSISEERQYSKATETKAKEIADAIYRDNPSWPKEKVMKIAWAQAKKTMVTESRRKLSRKLGWAAAKSSKAGGGSDGSGGSSDISEGKNMNKIMYATGLKKRPKGLSLPKNQKIRDKKAAEIELRDKENWVAPLGRLWGSTHSLSAALTYPKGHKALS